MPELLREEQRENWGSRPAFVLAAIGSAVGLGNLWGFPYKVYSHGGGAFLIPYVIAMLLIGIPLLIAEFSLGHLTQRATPDAFGRANRKFAFVGWWQIILSFIIVTYYAVILAYCVSFLYYSILGIVNGGQLPWAGVGIEGVEKAHDFFFKEYLNIGDGFALGKLQSHILLALVITWAGMYLCIFRGVRAVSKVVMWTVPLPWLMLLILTIRGLTLDGAVQGLEYYLEPDWSRLASPETWRWAFGQMFFSMSLAFGIMITYASFLHRKSDLNNNAAIIGLADMGTSFVAGLAVFATLGGMAYVSALHGTAVPVENVAKGGPSLAFVAFPYALAQLPHAAWFSLLFFGSLLLLGIDSAFSITECVLASIVDKTGWSRGKTLIALSLIGLSIGVLFCTQAGLNWLGTFDDFINGTWGITLTALLECLVLGWLFRLRRLREHANERSDWKVGRWWDWSIRVVIPAILAGLFAWSFFDSLQNPRGYARIYEPDEVSINIPSHDLLPKRAILQLQFVAEFSGKPEHRFVLDETGDSNTFKGWAVGKGEQAVEVSDSFEAASLAGKPLTFTTKNITPRTAYTVQYRWNSRPEKDAKTGLPIQTPDDQQPKWHETAKLTTTSNVAGMHIGNTVGLCLMGLVPILAIIIASLRIKKRQESPIDSHDDSSDSVGAGIFGSLAFLLGVGAVVVLGVAFADMLTAMRSLRMGETLQTQTISYIRWLLIASAICAVVAFLVGGSQVLKCEKQGKKAGRIPRFTGALGVLGMGLCGGLALAFTMLTVSFPETPIEYDGKLSTTAYIILACMLGILVVGLGWCFLKAIKAADSKAESEPQAPEGISQS